MPLWPCVDPVRAEIRFFKLERTELMTWRNPAAWAELETRRDALDGKLQLLNSFIEIHQRQGMIAEAVAESLLAGIESARADSEAWAAAMNRLAAAR